MANKNKKKNAAAKQKAAAAYMGRKNTPVQKTQPSQNMPKAEARKPAPTVQANRADKEQGKTAAPEAMRKEAVKRGAAKPAAGKAVSRSGKSNNKRKKQPLKLKDLRIDRVIGAVLVLCVLIAGVVALIFLRSNRFTVPEGAIFEYRGTKETNLFEIGDEEDASEQSRKASEMKRKGDIELFEYYAATKMVVADRGGDGWLNLTNVFNNKYDLMASLVDEAGNVCAHTRGIPAGYRLGEIKIDYSVPFGEHKMHLVVCAYDIDTHELVGVQYSDLTVQVGTEEVVTDA